MTMKTRRLFDRGFDGAQEETVSVRAIAERGANHDLVVVKRHLHTASVRGLLERLLLDVGGVSAQVANEEDGFEAR